VRLRPLEPGDVPQFRRYRLASDPKAIAYIVQTKDGIDIGAIGLSIGGPHAALAVAFADRRRLVDGCASDALRVMSSGAFRSLPLVRIEAIVPAGDAALVRAYQSAGFKREGMLRAAFRIRGAYRDAAMLSVIRHV
jgi:diamine N-acetyltransferase